MDIKSMLIESAQAQADSIKAEMMGHITSEEMGKKIATAINNRIDIPFVSEEKEQVFFEKCVDVVTDLMEGLFKDDD
tara:strand:- start:16145 stop:16375 length:231 start_codon:yes stop_codon:yes gene_type:complete